MNKGRKRKVYVKREKEKKRGKWRDEEMIR